jgi:hypothetical protein
VTLKRVVVDSSGWIEVFTGGGQAEYFLALMADERSMVVPAITSLKCSSGSCANTGRPRPFRRLR